MKGRFILCTCYWYCFVCHIRKQSSVSQDDKAKYRTLYNTRNYQHERGDKSIDLFSTCCHLLSSQENDEEIVDE